MPKQGPLFHEVIPPAAKVAPVTPLLLLIRAIDGNYLFATDRSDIITEEVWITYDAGDGTYRFNDSDADAVPLYYFTGSGMVML